MNWETWFLVSFTGLLVIVTYLLVHATNRYTSITEKLLKQSEEAFIQSSTVFKHQRQAFESNIISQMMFSAAQLAGNSNTRQFSGSFVIGMADALNEIDSGTYKKVEQGLKAWRKGKGGDVFEYILREVLGEKKRK